MKTNRILLAAALGSALLGGCSHEDGFTGGTGEAVSFTAGIQATRTTGGGDAWATGDKVGVFMLTTGGNLATPVDVLADNVQYKVTDAPTGALSPASGTPIYYPLSGTVDFIAYYPHGTVTAGVHKISVTDQTDPAAIDALYAKTTGMSKSNPEVRLTFRHVLSKVTLNVKAGAGITSADISGLAASAVAFGGMPAEASFALQDGALTAGTGSAQTLNPLKAGVSEVPAGYDASFTALLVPQGAGAYTGRTVTFTIGSQFYTWNIPAGEVFAAGSHYAYPVTVQKTGVTVGDPEIIDWATRDNGTGTTEHAQIVPEANSYMVEPGGMPILIPVSQANRVLTAEGLGAETRIGGQPVLGGVTADNYTVELVWSDLPVGVAGVIQEMFAHKVRGEGFIYVEPGTVGNAVIAIRDKTSGTIKWSWHIWVTESVTSKEDTETGLTWMDRNLGAKSNTPLVNGGFDQDQWLKTLGLYYQWGRKDAFPGSDGIGNNQTYYIGDATTGTMDDPPTGEYTELPGMVQNPLGFATNASFPGSLNADNNDNSWGGMSGQKTLYDPCPPGWKVPPVKVNGTNSWGNGTDEDSAEWSFINYVETYKGAIFNGVNGTAALGHFYPNTSVRCAPGTWTPEKCTGGFYWSGTYSLGEGQYGRTLLFSINDVPRSIFTDGGAATTYGFAVRCVSE